MKISMILLVSLLNEPRNSVVFVWLMW